MRVVNSIVDLIERWFLPICFIGASCGILLVVLLPSDGAWVLVRYKVITSGKIALAFLGIFSAIRILFAQHVKSLIKQYGTKEMCEAIAKVVEVQKRWNDSGAHPGLIVPMVGYTRKPKANFDWSVSLSNYSNIVDPLTHCRKFPWTKAEDEAIRTLKFYFRTPYILYRYGAVSRNTLLQVYDVDTICLLFDVIEIAEYIKNENYDYKIFYGIMEVSKKIYEEKERRVSAHKFARKYWDTKSIPPTYV